MRIQNNRLELAENLPSREKFHEVKWYRNNKWYGHHLAFLFGKLNFVNRIIESYVGKSWPECSRRITQVLKENGYAKYAVPKVYQDKLIDLYVYKTKDGRYIDSTGYHLDSWGGRIYVYDNIVCISKDNRPKQKNRHELKRISEVEELNGFIKDNLWFRKKNGYWYVADVKKQKYVRRNKTVINYIDGKRVSEVHTSIELLYKHAYGTSGNWVYDDYTSKLFCKPKIIRKLSYHPTAEEAEKVLKCFDAAKEEGIKYACFYEYFNTYPRLYPNVAHGIAKGFSSTYIEGNPVAINARMCSKKILKKYQLSNENTRRSYDSIT